MSTDPPCTTPVHLRSWHGSLAAENLTEYPGEKEVEKDKGKRKKKEEEENYEEED